MRTYDEFITLSVTECKNLGYLVPDEVRAGSVRWHDERGRKTAEIGVVIDARTVPYARFVYEYRGRTKDVKIPLRRKPSNLNPLNGYYLFVCPVTGLSCRKLYLVNGRFVSRWAFRALYPKQTVTASRRSGVAGYLSAVAELERLGNGRYRKPYYRGRPTPYGRKLGKLQSRIETLAPNNC